MRPAGAAAEQQQEDAFAGDAWAAGSQLQAAAETTFLEALQSEMQTRVEVRQLACLGLSAWLRLQSGSIVGFTDPAQGSQLSHWCADRQAGC